jgi:hypothetical protein
MDWRLRPTGKPTLREWEHWRHDTIRPLSQMLWPIYKPGVSRRSANRIAALNDTDFMLLSSLRRHFDQPISSRYPTTITHSVLFSEEDDNNIGFGSHYERYDPQLAFELRKELPGLLQKGYHQKVGTLALQIKEKLQRPRAYQVAFIQSRPDFTNQPAATADTPSMCSGHCLQASMAGGQFFDEAGPHMSQSSIEILQQFTVDIGDRRVFAGVHYPSDNLASWWTALHLIPRVFTAKRRNSVLKFLGDAITGKSLVFDAIRSQASSNKRSPYAKIVQKIEELSGHRR